MSEIAGVKIVGAGLIGTSIGLALRRENIPVWLENRSSTNLRLAIEYGAGAESIEVEPDLVIVCLPPDKTATQIAQELNLHPAAVVTDVASVKGAIREELKSLSDQTDRYIGSHPMAGRERGGAIAAQADLFFARPWVICNDSGSAESLDKIRQLVRLVGATAVELSVEEHDRAVALTSHMPQLISSILASELLDSDNQDLELGGQGLRDMTRIAASNPDLWTQIISKNSKSLAPLMRSMADRLNDAAEQIESVAGGGGLRGLYQLLTEGNDGVSRIPGKHGGKNRGYQTVVVMVDDKPGELARLLQEIGSIGVNIEDLRLEHSPGAQIGLAELDVLPESMETLAKELNKLGWRLA